MKVYQCPCGSPEIPAVAFVSSSEIPCPNCDLHVRDFLPFEVEETPKRRNYVLLHDAIQSAEGNPHALVMLSTMHKVATRSASLRTSRCMSSIEASR